MLKRDLILTARILARHGLASGPFGNISQREPGDPNRYWINPSGVYFEDLEIEELMSAAVESGQAVERGRASGFVERDSASGYKDGSHPGDCIHRAIYRRRPDVQAIVHVHSPATVMAAVLGVELEPFTQIGAAFQGDQGIYRGFTGPVRDAEEGEAIAEALGGRSIVMAQRHGIFAARGTLTAALWDMMLIDWAAREHLEARKLGLSKAEPVTAELVTKSRREVRELGHESIWKSELERLRKQDPALLARLGL